MITTVKSDAPSQHDLEVVLATATQQLSPASPVVTLLQSLASALARGADVTAVSHDHELTTNEAASLIGMSYPHLLTFMDSGALSFTAVGTHRRIKTVDLLDFNERRRAARANLTDARASARTAPQRQAHTSSRLSDSALSDLDAL